MPNEKIKEYPRVSVCCAYYNRADYLLDTVQSLLGQDYDSFEVIVVNDGSVDSRVKEILDGISDPRLVVIHQENSGFVSAIRNAIAHARGDYIAIQGAGDVSLPGRLRQQAELLDRNPAIGVAGCKTVDVVIGGPNDGYRLEKTYTSLRPDLGSFLGGNNPFTHGEVMFRRGLYQQVGGYRDFFRFAQDRDLWIRMAPHCQMEIINDLLYERRNFTSDGISTNRNKLVLQQALSQFARQCHFDRMRYGRDFLDVYGSHGGLFRSPSKGFAKSLAKLSIQCLVSGDPAQARVFATMAMREKIGLIPAFAAWISWISLRVPVFQSLFIWVMMKNKRARFWASIK